MIRVRIPGAAGWLWAGLLAIALACACGLAPTSVAWAEDEAQAEGEPQVNPDNRVDTGQLPDSSFIYSTSIYDLQTSDTYYESQTVQITGEVVGDIIYDEVEPDRRWITVNSLPGEQAASVQVYVSADQAALIDTLGRYQTTGSTVSIMGVYHLVCGQHDGLSDLHATSLTVTKAGHRDAEDFSWRRFVPATALVLVGLALFFVYRHRREELQ